MKIHKTIHAYIGPIWFHLVGVILEGRKWKVRKWYFLVFIWRRKCEGKLVGHEYCLHRPTKIQSPQIRKKMEKKGGKKSFTCFGWKFRPIKLFFSSRFCQFLLSFFVFLFFSFIFLPILLCVYPFFFCTSICFLICFALLCVCLFVYFNKVYIHTQLNWTNLYNLHFLS